MPVTRASSRGSRNDRRRTETRARLLEALRGMLLSGGVRDFTVEEITEAADVGKGTFYHHFASKEEALETLATAHAVRRNRAITRFVSTIEDPAEVIAVAFRHTLRQLTDDPIYRWFVFSSGIPQDRLGEVIGAGAKRDIERGFAEGRFLLPFSQALVNFLIGGGIAAAAGRIANTITEAELDATIEYVLRCLGVPPEEAAEIALRALPKLVEEAEG